MHTSISNYLAHLADKGRSPLTIKAARGDLIGFAAWWEAQFSRPFDPALLRERDLHAWRLARQKDEGAASTTINRALVTLRTYCNWAQRQGLITENPADEALLALLIYTGLRAQEACDGQIRDLDLDGGTVTVRHGKGGRMRRVMLNTEAISCDAATWLGCAAPKAFRRLVVSASESRYWLASKGRARPAAEEVGAAA